MASDYGLNFGFRRSDESMATREGRFKTPASGTALLLGTAVELDAATPGYLKQCAAAAPPQTGLRGLLVQEESHLIGSVFQAAPGLGHDSYDLGTAKKDQLSVMWAGVGTKAAVTLLDLTGVAVGNKLGWDGAKWIKDATNGWMTVTLISGLTYCEAVVTF
jgi:hypothetical protein